MENSEKLIERLFDRLDVWRNLPAYQLERRADIFFSLYLEKIIQKKFEQKINFLIPEFPIRVGEISEIDINKSFKVDYLAICEKEKKVFLIELKTDTTSRRVTQDWYLEEVQKRGVGILVDGLIKIYKATKQKRKYENLLNEVINAGWLERKGEVLGNCCSAYNVQIIYIQPTNSNNLEGIISFNDIISILSDEKDFFTRRFTKSLETWKLNPNTH